MKAVALYSHYGWKAKIGLIVPSTNIVNEPEFWQMAPDGVAIFTARAMLLGAASEESYYRMAAAVDGAAEQLATGGVDIVAYGCTSGSFVCPMDEIVDGMAKRTGTPAIAAAGAVVAALRALGAKRVALGTPYVDFVNQREVAFLQEYGFDVTAMQGLLLGEPQEERRAIGRVPPEAIYRLARAIDRPDADVIFLSCTNLASLDMIAEIEQELGKPVVTSNQACFWACLRRLGLKMPVSGYGTLLETCLDPITDADFALTAPAR